MKKSSFFFLMLLSFIGGLMFAFFKSGESVCIASYKDNGVINNECEE